MCKHWRGFRQGSKQIPDKAQGTPDERGFD